MGLVLQTTRRILSLAGRGARGARGPNGSPGSSPELIGLFTGASGMTGVPNGTQVLRTTGWRTPGVGRGLYLRDDAMVTDAFAGAHPRWTFRAADADGSVHGYRLVANEDGHVLFDAFGAHRDGVDLSTGQDNPAATSDDAAWNAYIDFSAATATRAWPQPAYRTMVPVRFGIGAYYFTTRQSLKAGSYDLRGATAGGIQLGGWGTVFLYAANVGGLTVQDAATDGEGADANGITIGAFGTRIDGITFRSQGGSTTHHYGLWIRAGGCKIYRCEAYQWSDHGIVWKGTSVGGGDAKGGPNTGIAESIISSFNNGDGFHVEGSDANANSFKNIICNKNGGWGWYDNSGLANSWNGGQSDGNGYVGSGRLVDTANAVGSVCSYNGNRYGVRYGKEAQAATTVPGSDESVWYYIDVGAPEVPAVPQWAAGGTWKAGGAGIFLGQSAPSAVVGAYVEQGQGKIQNVSGRAVFVGGTAAEYVLDGAGAFSTTDAGLTAFNALGFSNHYRVDDPAIGEVAASLGDPRERNRVERIRWGDPANPFETTLDFMPDFHNWLAWRYAGGEPFEAQLFPGQTQTFGRTMAPSRGKYIAALWCGSVRSNGRQIDMSDAAPTSDAHARGDIVFNINAAAGGKAGWICTAAGTPGTWKAFGVIDA